MHVRRNVWDLGGDWAAPILWYARAVASLRPKAMDDRIGWRFYAGMHGYQKGLWEFYGYQGPDEAPPPQPEFERFWMQCQHGSWHFLPWHRGYLIGFEKLIRATVSDIGGPDDWALPYWNYFRAGQGGLPPAFGSRDWPDGKGNNPLFIEQRWGPDPERPGDVFIPLDVVNIDALAASDFTGVTSGGDPGFGGVDTGFEHQGSVHGNVEAQPHDPVHGLIGGERLFPGVPRPLPGLMSAPQTAGLDPIFWLHHANIDRLWECWRRGDPHHADPADARWRDGPAGLGGRPFAVPLPDGSAWEFTPGQMSDMAGLDYTYDDFVPGDSAALLAAAAPRGATSADAMGAAVMSQPRVGRRAATVELVGASERPVSVVGRGVEATVLLDHGMQAKFAGLLAAGLAPGVQAEKVLLNLENVRGHSDATVLQVFVSFPSRDGAPAVESRVGSIGLFGISQASDPAEGHGGQGLSYVLNVTAPFAKFALAGPPNVNRIGVRLEGVAPVRAAAEVQVGRISIVRQVS